MKTRNKSINYAHSAPEAAKLLRLLRRYTQEKMTAHLSNRTAMLLQTVCSSETQSRLVSLFEREPALYAPESEQVLERVRFAAIKLATQGEKQLKLAETFYVNDSRDLLVSAEFSNDLNAHELWFTSVTGGGRVSHGDQLHSGPSGLRRTR